MQFNTGPLNLPQRLADATLTAQAQHPARDYLGLSSIGGCRRQTYYRYFPDQYDGGHTLETLLKFEQGHYIEAFLLQKMHRAGLLIRYAQEQVVWPLYPALVKGHIDGMIETPEGWALLEIKSVHSFSFTNLRKSEGGVPDQYPHYYMQLQAYLHCLQADPILPKPHLGVFLIQDKGTGVVASQWFAYDPVYVEHTIAPRLASLVKAIDTPHPHPPPRDFDPASHWQCKAYQCPFRNQCRLDGE